MVEGAKDLTRSFLQGTTKATAEEKMTKGKVKRNGQRGCCAGKKTKKQSSRRGVFYLRFFPRSLLEPFSA